jgi:UDP-N-acetylglucosamine--N-acetylmuramyl-(pentapeptide) pyrophosphoryl-undecaprenol N-acetylglucosamine transferase
VPQAGYEIELLDVRGLDRGDPLRAAGALVQAGAALPRARGILRERRVEALLGGGGYVAGPAGLAAISLRLPLVLTEADRHLGLTNRVLARHAARVCLAFPIAGRTGERYLVTGRPVPAAVGNADRDAARTRFGIAPGDHCLLVFGGSQGARSINLCALDAFAGADAAERPFHVLHLTGARDHAIAAERVGAGEGTPRYTLLAYEPGLADALAACDLVLARAGGSIFEIAAAGKPAILVPYPHAAGRHQHANAEWMAAAGAAAVIEDSELDPARLRTLVAELLADRRRLAAMAAAARSRARPDAARLVATEVLTAIGKASRP